MAIAITPEQQAVQASLRDWAKQAAPLAAVRRLEPDAATDEPSYLADLAATLFAAEAAGVAAWCSATAALARTDPDAPKHAGLTYFLV
ncbi:MAG TPA: hypothetical protein VGS06_41990, partial [Streptosporangiaceae bacterium]|nr:hypothetical protein [Streptosporangiaceae bacterium]